MPKIRYEEAKTKAEDINLADLNEKDHDSLTNVTASQHHTKAVSSDIDIQDANDVDKSAIADDKILVYKTTSSKHEYEAKPIGGGGTEVTVELTAGENIAQYDCVYLSAANTVKKTTGATFPEMAKVIGIAKAAITNGNAGDIIIMGKTTAHANGSVSVGDRLIGSGSGKVEAKQTGKTTSSADAHYHEIAPDGKTVGSSTMPAGSHSHTMTRAAINEPFNIAIALESGTNTDIDVLVKSA